jgi:hypothetical protein
MTQAESNMLWVGIGIGFLVAAAGVYVLNRVAFF